VTFYRRAFGTEGNAYESAGSAPNRIKMQQQLFTGASASPGCSCYDDIFTITGQ